MSEQYERESYLLVINMTSYFKRPMFMYSLGDIRFSKPIALKKLAYIVAAFILWSLPLVMIVGIQLNVFFLAAVIGPPLLIGHYMSKPLFGGMQLTEFAKVCFRFISEPRGWADLRGTEEVEETDYYVYHETWVSRRRELQFLARIAEQRHAEEEAAAEHAVEAPREEQPKTLAHRTPTPQLTLEEAR